MHFRDQIKCAVRSWQAIICGTGVSPVFFEKTHGRDAHATAQQSEKSSSIGVKPSVTSRITYHAKVTTQQDLRTVARDDLIIFALTHAAQGIIFTKWVTAVAVPGEDSA